MYEFAKAIYHSLCHHQLQGQAAAWGPSGDPSCVGALGAPHFAVLSRFWVTTRLDEPLHSLFQMDLLSHFWCHFSFSNKPTRCCSPQGDPVPFEPGVGGCIRGAVRTPTCLSPRE